MIKNFIIGLSLIALGVIVVGSLDAARMWPPTLPSRTQAASSMSSVPSGKSVGSGSLRFHKWDERGCSRREC